MSPLPTDRDTTDSAADHVADHNTLHAEYNTPTHTHTGTSVDLGYAQVTADQNTISTVTDLTGLSKAVTVLSGHRIKVTGYAEFSSSAAGNRADLWIYEGASALNRGTTTISDTGFTCSAVVVWVGTPSAGSHTYKLRGELGGGAGSVSMKAGATIPAFILIEDLGVASA